MHTCDIQDVEVVSGLIPSLQWTVKLRLSFGPEMQRLFPSRWMGEIAFTRQPEGEGSLSPTGPNKLVLPALWASESEDPPFWSNSDYVQQFRCEMRPDILDGIERFRDGGRLYARVQGKVQVFRLGTDTTNANSILLALAKSYASIPRDLWHNVWGASYELTRDTWCGKLLGQLRPPGRIILEATIPAGIPTEVHGQKAVEYLDRARRAFDEGRYTESVRDTYQAGEALQQLNSVVAARYGEKIQKALSAQIGGLHQLCNLERHHQKHDPSQSMAVDRPLAQHALISLQSLIAVYLKA
jgi:hypothetical protein